MGRPVQYNAKGRAYAQLRSKLLAQVRRSEKSLFFLNMRLGNLKAKISALDLLIEMEGKVTCQGTCAAVSSPGLAPTNTP